MKNCIILPTYNERENISPLIEEIFSILPQIYILVVDDNSPDGTASAVEKLMPSYSNLLLLKRPKKNGLGRAYIDAFKKLLTDESIKNIIMMDADFSHNPKYIPTMLSEAINYNLVIGSRYIKGGGISQWELWRRFLSVGGNIYVRLILGMNIRDWTGGFYCIDTRLLKNTDLDKIDFQGYAFQIGLKYFLLKSGACLKEVPIIFEIRRNGESKLSGHIISEGIIAPWKILLKK